MSLHKDEHEDEHEDEHKPEKFDIKKNIRERRAVEQKEKKDGFIESGKMNNFKMLFDEIDKIYLINIGVFDKPKQGSSPWYADKKLIINTHEMILSKLKNKILDLAKMTKAHRKEDEQPEYNLNMLHDEIVKLQRQQRQPPRQQPSRQQPSRQQPPPLPPLPQQQQQQQRQRQRQQQQQQRKPNQNVLETPGTRRGDVRVQIITEPSRRKHDIVAGYDSDSVSELEYDGGGVESTAEYGDIDLYSNIFALFIYAYNIMYGIVQYSLLIQYHNNINKENFNLARSDKIIDIFIDTILVKVEPSDYYSRLNEFVKSNKGTYNVGKFHEFLFKLKSEGKILKLQTLFGILKLYIIIYLNLKLFKAYKIYLDHGSTKRSGTTLNDNIEIWNQRLGTNEYMYNEASIKAFNEMTYKEQHDALYNFIQRIYELITMD